MEKEREKAEGGRKATLACSYSAKAGSARAGEREREGGVGAGGVGARERVRKMQKIGGLSLGDRPPHPAAN
jgi:hypothetical protein